MQSENYKKLLKLAGNQHCYQYFVAILCLIFWCNVNILDFSLGFLENPPTISYFDETTNKTIAETLSHEKCGTDYIELERSEFSWINELRIECDQFRISLIGTLVSVGLLLGAITYSYITKLFGQKNALLLSNAVFIVVLLLTLFIKKYAYFCVTVVICPYMCNIISYSSMVLFSEIISDERRSNLNTLINSGLALGGLFYCLMYYLLHKWEHVFIVCLSIAAVLEILVIFFIFDSFQEYIKRKDVEGMLKALRFIAKMNFRRKIFDEEIKKEEYQSILREIRGQDYIPSTPQTPKEKEENNIIDDIPKFNLNTGNAVEKKSPVKETPKGNENNILIYKETEDAILPRPTSSATS